MEHVKTIFRSICDSAWVSHIWELKRFMSSSWGKANHRPGFLQEKVTYCLRWLVYGPAVKSEVSSNLLFDTSMSACLLCGATPVGSTFKVIVEFSGFELWIFICARTSSWPSTAGMCMQGLFAAPLTSRMQIPNTHASSG